jgi:lipid A disaccharide synthetase
MTTVYYVSSQRSAAADKKRELDSIYAAIENDEYDEEDIYGSVVPSKQASPERTASVESKRIHVVMELLDTERSYVDALQMIVDHFLHPMMNSITMEDKSKIFLNIELLLKDHKRFLEKLEASNRKGAIDISSCFLAQVEDLLKYGFFCSRLPDAQNRVSTE